MLAMSVAIAMCALQYLPGSIGAFGYANRTTSARQLFAHHKHLCFTYVTLCTFLCGRCPYQVDFYEGQGNDEWQHHPGVLGLLNKPCTNVTLQFCFHVLVSLFMASSGRFIIESLLLVPRVLSNSFILSSPPSWTGLTPGM